MQVTDLKVEEIDFDTAKAFVEANHYLGFINDTAEYNYGAFLGKELKGVICFARNQTAQTQVVYNISRLVMSDDCPPNSESYFIGAAIRKFTAKVKTDIIGTHIQPSKGHLGTVYKASGFKQEVVETPNDDFIYFYKEVTK